MQTYGSAPPRIGKTTGKAKPSKPKPAPKPAGKGLINRGKRY